MIRVAYFGLPLGALALAARGVEPWLVVLSPTDAPGRRRVHRVFGARAVDARGVDPGRFEAELARKMEREPFDLVASWYWTRLVPSKWIERAPLGGIGVHPSLLPRHRGPDPFFWAIDSGDHVTGVTVHRLTGRYDEGAIVASEPLAIGDRDSWELARALDRPSLRLFVDTVLRFTHGESVAATPQDEANATLAPKPEGDHLRVDFRGSTERVLRRIRALAPVPGLALSIRGVDVFVTRACATAEFPAALAPGEAWRGPENVVIRTGDSAIGVTRAIVADGEEELEMSGRDLAARVFDERG